MSAEKYTFDSTSVEVIESLFDRIHERAVAEFGSGWANSKVKNGFVKKVLEHYVQQDAESLIEEYVKADLEDQDGSQLTQLLDGVMTYEQRAECRLTEVYFGSVRGLPDPDDTEISTVYIIGLKSEVSVDDVEDVAEMVRDKVRMKLRRSESEHTDRRLSGELEEEDGSDDFDGSLTFIKDHTFELQEMKELLTYTVKYRYEGADFSVPMYSVSPDQSSILTAKTTTDTASSANDLTLRMFEDIIRGQDVAQTTLESPVRMRVRQIMAILAILDYGDVSGTPHADIIDDLL